MNVLQECMRLAERAYECLHYLSSLSHRVFSCTRLLCRYRLNRIQRLDLMHGILLLSGAYFVNWISVQFILTFVRKGLFKLKMMNVLVEVGLACCSLV
jgi:hypothetical protein